MTDPMLETLTVANFRSIRDTISIPLDSPITLVHGANGAGKTSLLSALELALTGEIASMRRFDRGYKRFLAHHGVGQGRVSISGVRPGQQEVSQAEVLVGEAGVSGAAFLGDADARFFAERCYLAQATVSRLLEIYQDVEPRGDSALTRYVKDLLGLDQIDALIDGLEASHDLRNTRRQVPAYAEYQASQKAMTERISIEEQELLPLERRAHDLRSQVGDLLEGAFPELATRGGDWSAPDMARTLRAMSAESQLTAHLAVKRELDAVASQLKAMGEEGGAHRLLAEVEGGLSEATAAVEAWRSSTGNRLESLIDSLRADFPELPSVASTDPKLAFATATSQVERELTRCLSTITEDDQCILRVTDSESSLDRARARLDMVEQRMRAISSETGALARALAEVLPHIHDEQCPVCGRDFTELEDGSLAELVTDRIAALSSKADELQELERAKLESSSDLQRITSELSRLATQRLDSSARASIKTRIARLTESRDQLLALEPSVGEGAESLRRLADARRRNSALRSEVQLLSDASLLVERVSEELGEPELLTSVGVKDAVTKLVTQVSWLIDRLSAREESRMTAIRLCDDLEQTERRRAAVTQRLEEQRARFQSLQSAFRESERRRSSVRNLARVADETRTEIVGRVFNTSLNKLWRDLFVRLAPTEPFVPAFQLPGGAGGPVSARLETVHRAGGQGGAPGAMLSAGNLNTAALTLFLALHLSVERRLPWLILDDPVQSMDDVHISHFAALLRTISKEHGRKVVIAVHDRPLFDYLTLELSAAVPGDRLTTVELSRAKDQSTRVEFDIHPYAAEPALSA